MDILELNTMCGMKSTLDGYNSGFTWQKVGLVNCKVSRKNILQHEKKMEEASTLEACEHKRLRDEPEIGISEE
jgi:hypothetical protein